MANKIAGLTIEIGGETTGLTKALSGVNKQSRDLQSELKQVDRLLKLDPKNPELLAQKQKIFAESITNTKNKLDTLKEAEKQAQAQFKKGEISEEQYRALQREVINTEQSLGKLESQALKSNAVLSKDQAVSNLKNIATAAGTAAVAVGVTLAGAAFKAGQSADDINTLAKQTGLTTEEIQKFQYASERIDVPLDTLTGSMAKLTKNMGNAQKGTGDAAKAFETLGVKVENNDGSLRSNQDVFDETIKKLSEMENETQRDALAMQIFGKSAQDLNPLILGGADALNELGKEAEDAGLILSQDALDSANQFNDSMDKLKAVSAGIFGKLGAEIAEQLIPFMEKLLEVVQGLPEWFEKNKTLLELIGVAVGTVTALVIAFNIQQALLASGLTLWGSIAAGATAITTGLGTAFAFLTSPIGLVILAIGAVIAIAVLLYKNWDTVTEKAGKLGSSIKDKFNQIKTSITTPINNAKDTVKNAIDKIKNFFKFKWSLPKLKLPHFSVSGKFSIAPPSIPKFNISWYKDGGILTQPTIFGALGNKLLAGGESGTGGEAILPLNRLVPIMSEAMKSLGMGTSNSEMIYLLRKIAEKDTSVYLDGGELANGMINHIDDGLNKKIYDNSWATGGI